MSNNNTSGGMMPPDFNSIYTNDDIQRITFEFHRRPSKIFRDGKKHEATVHFKKNNSTSRQDFFSDDPEELRQQVENFTNNIR